MQRPGRWTWVHLASLVGILSALVVLSRGQWFFGDEWDFLLFRGVAHPAVGVFYPHNEHWSTLPILWYRAVFQVFALRSYWPYLLSLFAIHLAVVHLLWRCVIRAGVPASIATVGAAAFGLFGAGSENLLWAFQIGFVGSLAAGLGLGLAVNGPPERRRVALVSAGAIVSLMISGISVVMVGYVGLVALRRWGWRLAVIATAPAALVYVAWLKWQGDAGLDGATRPFHGGVRDIPRFAFGGISATLGAPVQSVRFGEVAFWVLVGFVVINVDDGGEARQNALLSRRARL